MHCETANYTREIMWQAVIYYILKGHPIRWTPSASSVLFAPKRVKANYVEMSKGLKRAGNEPIPAGQIQDAFQRQRHMVAPEQRINLAGVWVLVPHSAGVESLNSDARVDASDVHMVAMKAIATNETSNEAFNNQFIFLVLCSVFIKE